MEKDFQRSVFYRAVMTGLFVGIVATLLTIFLDMVFVDYFHFPLSSYINVSTLIFAVNILFVVIGFIYYSFISAFKKGDALFTIVFVLLTIFLVWKAEGAHRAIDEHVNAQFRTLLSGIIIILALAAIAIPILFHNKKFERLAL